ncbi:protein FAM216A isoform X2 [Lates calcarifer]|uniref:Protein FAM216A isoform X2 n=1 Tax=Lates calcarifer TaxID=8187 RepID=A0AAJ8BL52_LATCA|nr:protein FAM216A isoform X2 [Lates calcarifer]
MKKQVTFAESQTVHRLQQDKAVPRTGMNELKMACKDSGLKINRAPAARKEPQLQHLTPIQIPKAMTAAPFLKHAALTPGQKEYLYTIAASYSTAHVRNLITQHYMNVLHRCIRAGYSPNRDDLVVTSVTLPENESEKHQSKTQSEISSGEKTQGENKYQDKTSWKILSPKNPKQTSQIF